MPLQYSLKQQEILRCVRKSLEERMSKEDADKWIDKVVRRSAMTEKEEIIVQ